jgi:hypothetical protein
MDLRIQSGNAKFSDLLTDVLSSDETSYTTVIRILCILRRRSFLNSFRFRCCSQAS